MPRLFVSNVTLEHELSPNRQSLPKQLLRLRSELSCLWLAVADEGDWIWCPEPVEAEFWSRMEGHGCCRIHVCGPSSPPPAGLELVPWGWSAPIRALAETLRARVWAPPQDVVTLTNSRTFSSDTETEWRCGLAGSAVVGTTAELEAALKALPSDSRWVLKCEHGAAGRDRLLGHGSLPPPQALRWIQARLADGGPLYFEPWVSAVREAGLQWHIPPSGPPRLLGITPLLCDRSGRFCGSCFGEDSEAHRDWSDAIEISRRAVERIQHAGYFGPVGIDAMRYRDSDGEPRLRPLQDINARWTMGRIALGWKRVCPSGVWRHGTAREFAVAAGSHTLIQTSPNQVGARPVGHCTWITPGDCMHSRVR
jgi:hypothetical protein